MLDALYLVVGFLALPWVAWRRLSGSRPVAAPWRRLTGNVPELPRRAGVERLWLHGVSVGEVQLLAGLAEELQRQATDAGRTIECVVSSSTTTGLSVAARRFPAERVFPCPLDFSWAVERTLDRIRPDLLVLGELELWPNLLLRTRARGIPIVIANARMSERSFNGYRRIPPLIRRMLGCVSLVMARSAADAGRFMALGAPRAVVAGSLKFDGVRGDREATGVQKLARLAGFAADDIVFLAGSTQAPEEAMAIEVARGLLPRHPSLRLVLVPRHVERAGEVASLLEASGLAWQRRSRLEADGADPDARVLLVDTTGELAQWWGTAEIAFVGGSLDGRRGGQNMLEPAAYAAAVAFGPHTRNFRDEVAVLLAADAAKVVHNAGQLADFVRGCLENPAAAAALGERARIAVAANRGATPRTAERILGLLPSPRLSESASSR